MSKKRKNWSSKELKPALDVLMDEELLKGITTPDDVIRGHYDKIPGKEHYKRDLGIVTKSSASGKLKSLKKQYREGKLNANMLVNEQMPLGNSINPRNQVVDPNIGNNGNIGLNNSNVGLNNSNVGLNNSNVGLNSNIGNNSNVGLSNSIGLNKFLDPKDLKESELLNEQEKLFLDNIPQTDLYQRCLDVLRNDKKRACKVIPNFQPTQNNPLEQEEKPKAEVVEEEEKDLDLSLDFDDSPEPPRIDQPKLSHEINFDDISDGLHFEQNGHVIAFHGDEDNRFVLLIVKRNGMILELALANSSVTFTWKQDMNFIVPQLGISNQDQTSVQTYMSSRRMFTISQTIELKHAIEPSKMINKQTAEWAYFAFPFKKANKNIKILIN